MISKFWAQRWRMPQIPGSEIAAMLNKLNVNSITSSADTKLAVKDLSKTYGSFTALHPTDLELKAGEFMTLLGPSGSGKTTLLMMVAGLLNSDTGDLWIDGRRTTNAPPWERGIGMVFQNYALFPHMSVFENVAFPLQMRNAPPDVIKREVTNVLQMVQLEHTANRRPRDLSGGQQQRIALARAFVFKPHIILMDEPLGALDKNLRDQLQLEIKNIHLTHKTTILYVTHDQGEALTMSDRICLMNHGRIKQLDTPSELYFRPKTVFAADFLGDSNFIDGEVVGRNGDYVHLATNFDRQTILRGYGPTLSTGDKAKMMVRPERLKLSTDVPQDWNAIPVTVKQSIFVGGFTRHYVSDPTGAEMAVLELTSGPNGQPMAGQRLMAVWSPDSAVVLPNAPGRS